MTGAATPARTPVCLVDGLAALGDRSSVDINTAACDRFNGSGVLVVMPVRRTSILCTDWYQPAVRNGTRRT